MKQSETFDPAEQPISPEVPLLIEDLETSINEGVDAHLDGEPYKLRVTNFIPELVNGRTIYGIGRLQREIIEKIAPGPREFIGIDILASFPMNFEDTKANAEENPLNITIKWSGGIQCRLALTANMPILLVEESKEDGATLFAGMPEMDEFNTYINSIGLPESIWKSNVDTLADDLLMSERVAVARTLDTAVDYTTHLSVIEETQYLTNETGETQTIKELVVNVDHQNESRIENGMIVQGVSKFRNLLRFDRDELDTAWHYRGMYAGKLETGELLEELVQVNPTLGVPNGKVLNKALKYLSQRPY